jgi:hypothetical protein
VKCEKGIKELYLTFNRFALHSFAAEHILPFRFNGTHCERKLTKNIANDLNRFKNDPCRKTLVPFLPENNILKEIFGNHCYNLERFDNADKLLTLSLFFFCLINHDGDHY